MILTVLKSAGEDTVGCPSPGMCVILPWLDGAYGLWAENRRGKLTLSLGITVHGFNLGFGCLRLTSIDHLTEVVFWAAAL